jgi:hypothetical protein
MGKEVKKMKWVDFLNQLLEEKQIEVLRCALKIKAHVYFYGSGLGKSTAVRVLRAAGYVASEPGMIAGGCLGCAGVPDGSDVVCFNVKKRTLDKLMPELSEVLIDQKNEIVRWVNS